MRLRGLVPRRPAAFFLLLFLAQLLGCGSVHVAGVFQPSTVTVITGTVSFVGLSVISGSNGTFVTVTGVTLIVPFGSSFFTFCGDQRPNFVMNNTVQVSFTAGQSCSNLVSVASKTTH